MGQLKDIPYSILKEDERAYEVMLLRDQYDNAYSDIAKEYDVSVNRIVTLYNRTKIKQLRLYARHLAIVHGHENTATFRLSEVHDCYWDFRYVAAYFEKKYDDILTAYRSGEPGMPETLIATLPPFKEKLKAKEVARLIELREVDKKSYPAIGAELKLTTERARREYELVYHRKVRAAIDKIKEKTGADVSGHYLELRCGSKKQFEMIMRDYHGLFEDE